MQLVTQRLPSQASPARHAVPHDPQLDGSLVRSEQVRAPPVVAQVVSPPVQVSWHTPMEQTSPGPHRVPQAAQLLLSVASSTH
ncbi:MAG TPA: hypothetical protein PK156_37915, partial [Polyangium sp.]|nr:hypothetical protein [Polyangium sp.]